MLKKIDSDGLMAPLQVIQTLGANGVAKMGLVKKYLGETIERERKEIENVRLNLHETDNLAFTLADSLIGRTDVLRSHIRIRPLRNGTSWHHSHPSQPSSIHADALPVAPLSTFRPYIFSANTHSINAA